MIRILFLPVFLFSLVCFFFGFIWFHGFLPEGLPLGSVFGCRDVSGYTYRALLELAKETADRDFEKTVELDVGKERKWLLDFQRHIFIDVNQEKLLSEYRRLKSQKPIWQKFREFLFASYIPCVFQDVFEIDSKKTLHAMEKILPLKTDVRYMVQGEILKKMSMELDSQKLLQYFDTCLHSPDHYCTYSLSPSFVEENVPQKIFGYSQGRESFQWSQGNTSLLSSVAAVPVLTSFILNPGEVFSFRDFYQGTGFTFLEQTEDELGEEWQNTLELQMASWLYQEACRWGFSILERHSHPYFNPGTSRILPGMDAYTDIKKDLIFRNILNRPFRFQLEIQDNILKTELFSCLEEEVPVLEEISREMVYPGMHTLRDETLQEGVKILERKPLAGLKISWRSFRMSKGRKLIQSFWNGRYRSRAGIVRLSSRGVNLFDPDSWKDLGIEDVWRKR